MKIVRYSIVLLALLLMSGCSTQKAGWSNVAFHNTTAHYNVWWNGNESYKDGVKQLEKQLHDDYTQILPIYKLGSKDEAASVNPQMDKAIEKGESIVDSVIREIHEETGLKISNLELCGVKDWITEEGTRYIVFLYKTGTYSGTVKSSSEGKVFWMPLEELKSKKPFWHMDKMLDLFCGCKFSELFLEGEHRNRTPVLR